MRISRVICCLCRDEVPPRKLIIITLTCCVLLMFIPNFNVLPDRRMGWWPVRSCRIPAEVKAIISNPQTLRLRHLKHRCRLGINLEIRIDEDFKLFTDLSHSKDRPNQPVCKYQVIYASRKRLGFELGTWSVWFSHTMQLPIKTEYLHLVCAVNQTSLVADEFIAVAPARMTNSRKTKQQNLTQQLHHETFKTNMNFIIVSIEGLSRIDFIQSLSYTHKFLIRDLKSFDMKYHSLLGASSRDNIIPLLTGKSEDDIVKEWKHMGKETSPLNALLWNHFEKDGYLTLSTEDDPGQGTMTYLMKWLDSLPTHYSTLPLMRAFHSTNAVAASFKPCLRDEASRKNFHLGYVRKFFKIFSYQPLFSYINFSRLNLTDLYETTLLDNDLKQFLEEFFESGHLNNSALVMISNEVGQTDTDHLKTPFVYLSMPPWLADDYPDAVSNLRRNSDSLTTNYDLYETIVDLLHLNKSDTRARDVPGRRAGQSLLRKILHPRDCKTLLVPEDFCICV